MPKTQPLTAWWCDQCGERVSAEDGYVTWRNGPQPHSVADFKIIHKKRCDDHSHPSSLPLRDFLGFDGLAKLTSFLSVGELHLARSSQRNDPEDIRPRECMDDFIDFFRRVQLPYYEEARMHYSDPAYWQDQDGANEFVIYTQRDLQEAAVREVDRG